MNRRRQFFPPLLVFVLTLMILLSGCEEGSTPTVYEPVEDPAEALISQALLVGGGVRVATTDLQNKLNAGQSDLVGRSYVSQSATDILDGLVSTTNGYVYSAGILNAQGIVVNVRPEEYESILGVSWADREEVVNSLAEPRLEIGAPFTVNDDWTSMYTRSIAYANDVQGVLFVLFDLDTLFTRTVEFAGIDTVENREFFALDQDGRVLFSTFDGFTGSMFTDDQTYTENQVLLAEDMISADMDEGSTTIDLSGSPGGEGERYLGWVQIKPLVNGRFWSMAVSLPVGESE